MAQGNPQDDFVQVAPDSTGKKLDTAKLTRDDATVVERQRAAIGSDENYLLQVTVGGEVGQGELHIGGTVLEKLEEISNTLKMIALSLCLAYDQDIEAVQEIVNLNDM